MGLALSTSWFPQPGAGVLETIRVAREFGFRDFEIGVTEEPFPLDEVASLVRGGEIRVVSVHNVCARTRLRGKNARGDFLAHPSPSKRRDTVKATLETIDAARTLGAPVVVAHLGEARIRAAARRQSRLARFYAEFGPTRDLTDEVQRLMRKRRDPVLRAMDALRQSLREIFDAAPDASLGVENRYYFHQIPLPDELEALFRDFPSPRLVYWHDVGHAHALDALGIVPHATWFDRFGARLAGLHLHDVIQLTDHLPPGAGHFDFASIRDRIPAGAVRVLELHDGYPGAQLAAARRFLERHLSPATDPPPPRTCEGPA